MNGIDISIVIPTYNRPEFLPRMLDSVLAQSFRNFEIILINNGSTDNQTDEICLSYKLRDTRVRLLSIMDNQGPAGARNLGISNAKGKYIIHLDDDDYCEPDHLALLYQLITEHEADVAISGCVDEMDGKILSKHEYEGVFVWDKQNAVSEFLKREKFHAAPATKLYRRDLFDHVKYRPGMIIDDIHVTYRLFTHANKAVAHGIPTYRFRKFSGNTTSFLEKDIVWPELLDEYLQMQQDRIQYITAHVPEEEEHVKYAAWSYMISMVEKINRGRGEGCEAQLIRMVEELRRNSFTFLNCNWITKREIGLMQSLVLRAND
jgi:glycosyltransferase involved in cell wall biosynthesis